LKRNKLFLKTFIISIQTMATSGTPTPVATLSPLAFDFYQGCSAGTEVINTRKTNAAADHISMTGWKTS